MHATIGICALLLGGWVLPSDTLLEEDQGHLLDPPPLDTPEPPTDARLPAPEPPTDAPLPGRSSLDIATPQGSGPDGATADHAGPERARQEQRRPEAAGSEGASRGVGELTSRPQVAQATVPRERRLPMSPTDPRLGGPDSPFTTPTSPSARGYTSGSSLPPMSTQGTRNSPYATGRSSTRRPQGMARSQRPSYQPRSSYYSQQQRGGRSPYQRSAATSLPATPLKKPFADYRPAPTVSPYLNLFRSDNSLGLIDNYNTLVRPLIEQRRANRNLGGQIHRLQSASRAQSSAINNLNRTSNVMQGVSSPQYYQNYHDFFPGQ